MTPVAAQPLLELLREATAQGRPALTLTFARVAELLGEMPDDRWWDEQRGALRSSGYDATLDHARRWVTFAPATAPAPAPDDAAPTTVDVRVTFPWGSTAATAWVEGIPVPIALSDETARRLETAVREHRTAGTTGRGGGSGI